MREEVWGEHCEGGRGGGGGGRRVNNGGKRGKGRGRRGEKTWGVREER